MGGATPSRTSGSSIYPAVQNMLLAARALGLGATLTTLYLTFEKEVEAALGLPADVHSYALLPIGYPMGRFGPVRRVPLAEVVYRDRGVSRIRRELGIGEERFREFAADGRLPMRKGPLQSPRSRNQSTPVTAPLSAVDQQRLFDGARHRGDGVSSQRRGAQSCSAWPIADGSTSGWCAGNAAPKFAACPGTAWSACAQAASMIHHGCGRPSTSGSAASSRVSPLPRATRFRRATARLTTGALIGLDAIPCLSRSNQHRLGRLSATPPGSSPGTKRRNPMSIGAMST